MAVITVFSGPFCFGEDVTEGVAVKLGYRRIDDELFSKAASTYPLPEEKLRRALYKDPSFFGKLKNERERAIAYLRAALADLLQEDDLILHGYAAHLVPLTISHVLKVCLIANNDYRAQLAAKEKGIAVEKGLELIHREDNARGEWTHYIRHNDPYEESMYDILLAMQSTTVPDAIESISRAATVDELKRTEASKQAVADFALAAAVEIALTEKGLEVTVKAEKGKVHVYLDKYTNRLEHQKQRVAEIARGVEGVKDVSSSPGTHFTPPSLMPMPELSAPSRVLLVDDEKEFVHTLSERLLTRNLESAVVYDGEQALDFIEREEPEVMVLDLKMPGIDGIEVLRRVKKSHPEIEVIILTGHGSDRERDIALDLGAFAYLQKPVNIDILAKKMKEAQEKINQAKRES